MKSLLRSPDLPFGVDLLLPKVVRSSLNKFIEHLLYLIFLPIVILTSSVQPHVLCMHLLQVGGGARKTNYDYTRGKLKELVEICIEFGAAIFVCAVGVPPKWVVDRFHEAGVMVMNMVGTPKHVPKVCMSLFPSLF